MIHILLNKRGEKMNRGPRIDQIMLGTSTMLISNAQAHVDWSYIIMWGKPPNNRILRKIGLEPYQGAQMK